jgi:S1-C subfamily serine protease
VTIRRGLLNLVLAGVLLASFAGRLGSTSAQAQLDAATEARVARATVLIVALVLEVENGIVVREFRRVPLGSGIIVSADGLILTNSHVIDLTDLQNDVENEENTQGVDLEIEDAFLIYAVDGMDDAPDPRYSATVVIDQRSLDLAVLSVSGNERGLELSQPVGADRTPVVLSSSGAISSRDPVQIFGYPVFGSDSFPDAGSTTIDVVDGRVRSLETGPGIGNIERIHIDATVSGGSSGGAVVDEQGRLIGIVAQALGGAAGGSEAVAIPVNRARTVLTAAGWVEPPPTSAPTPDEPTEPTATPTQTEETPALPTATAIPTAIPTTSPTAEETEDAARFAELLEARNGVSPLAGPLAGQITQVVGYVAVAGAGLTTADFSATATFANPAQLSGTRWDFGFGFHLTANSAEQVAVDSNGNWYYVPYPGGTTKSGVIPVFDSSPGGTNVVDLIVEGQTALFGVNGQFLTRLDLPPAIPSDVQVGSGFFTDAVEAGRAIAYSDFSVWPVRPSPTSEPTSTPMATSTAVPETATPTIDDSEQAARFADLLATRSETEPLGGPLSGEIVQDESFIAFQGANLTLTDFSAEVTFVNPAELTGVSWDFGFAFHRSTDRSEQIAIDSNGNWYYAPAPEGLQRSGTVPSFDPNPGARNTLDLFVEGSTAIFGVNKQFVAQLDLQAPVPSDILVGSGFFRTTTEHGRAIAYEGFEVWPSATSTSVSPTATPIAATSTPVATVAPVETPATLVDPIAALSFDLLLRESEGLPGVGPFTGTLEEETPGEIPMASAGVTLTDFGASVTFTNPDTSAAEADIGFRFRVGADSVATNWIVVDSLGVVYARIAGAEAIRAGTAIAYDTSPGATNTLQLFVRAGEALVGVNDQFVAALDLPAEPVAADVWVGTAFFGVDFVQDRITSYRDFRVWELPTEPAPSTLAQEESTATAFKSESAPSPTGTP